MTREKKMQIVIDNYFKSECNVDTSIRDAFEKGFRIGVQKTVHRPEDEWIVREYCTNELDYRRWIEIECPVCGEKPTYENLNNMNYCPNCGARMTPYKGGDDECS